MYCIQWAAAVHVGDGGGCSTVCGEKYSYYCVQIGTVLPPARGWLQYSLCTPIIVYRLALSYLQRGVLQYSLCTPIILHILVLSCLRGVVCSTVCVLPNILLRLVLSCLQRGVDCSTVWDEYCCQRNVQETGRSFKSMANYR